MPDKLIEEKKNLEYYISNRHFRVYFRTEKISRDKEESHIMIKALIHQEYIIILNINPPSYRSFKNT